MTHTETITILRRYNKWRRGNLDDQPMPDPREIGEAIDVAVEMIDSLEAAEKECNALRADKATLQQMTYSLKDHLEAAEKARDNIEQQLVQSEIGKREISEAHSAVTKRLSVLADENTALRAKVIYWKEQKEPGAAGWRAIAYRLRAKIEQMEKQEPVAWMLNCQTLGGDTGWILSWTQSWEGLCNRLQGEENEKRLYALPGAQPAPSVPDRITPEQAPPEIVEYAPIAAEGYADGWNDCIRTMLAAAPKPEGE